MFTAETDAWVADLHWLRAGEVLLDLIDGSRDDSYANDPAMFTRDTDRLILVKRTIFTTEIVRD